MSAAFEFAWTGDEPETSLCALLEHSPFPAAQIWEQGRVRALNSAMERLLAEGAKTEQPSHWSDILREQEYIHAKQLLDDLFSGRKSYVQLDRSSAMRENHNPRWFAWRLSRKNGCPAYVLMRVDDLSGTGNNEQRLRQAEKLEAIGRLAGGIAHDFNNLLTGVLLYCDLLLASLEPGHRVRRYGEEIRSAGLQASGLVRQLLTLSRPSNTTPRLLSLNEIAEGMRNLLIRLIGENIELKMNLDSHLGLVMMDPSQAQQVLLNLILNARDAMPGGGQVRIETRNCKLEMMAEQSSSPSHAAFSCAVLIISDDGSGMDAATRAHLFDAFFTTKSAGKGTGLGLATVHDIVTRSGGLIHVDSAPGHGTRVTVILPLSSDPALCANENDFCPERTEGVFQ